MWGNFFLYSKTINTSASGAKKPGLEINLHRSQHHWALGWSLAHFVPQFLYSQSKNDSRTCFIAPLKEFNQLIQSSAQLHNYLFHKYLLSACCMFRGPGMQQQQNKILLHVIKELTCRHLGTSRATASGVTSSW